MKNITSLIKKINNMFVKAIVFLWKEYHFLIPICMWKRYIKLFNKKINYIFTTFYNPMDINEYNQYILKKNNCNLILNDNLNCIVDVFILSYNNEILNDTIISCLKQTYKNLNIYVVGNFKRTDNIYEKNVLFENVEKKDILLKINDIAKKSKSDYFTFLVSGDTIEKDYILYGLNEMINKKTDIVYFDNDVINLDNRLCNPFFKPDFSYDTLLSFNYIDNAFLIKKSIFNFVGGFNTNFTNQYIYDLLLKTINKKVSFAHVAEVFYHKNEKNNKFDKKESYEIINDFLKNKSLDFTIIQKHNCNIIKYKINYKPLVSIIIPTKDLSDMLAECIDFIYSKTKYKNYEIIVVNNNSVEEKTYELFKKYKKKYNNFNVLDVPIKFNYSKLNNIAVDNCNGEFVVFLNNDTKIITPEWLDLMIGYASQKHIGAVGIKLLYKDNTIQHGGVLLGVNGVATHAFMGYKKNDFGINNRLMVPYNYNAVTAACLMIEKQKFLNVGGFDENLAVSYNDIDLNLKLVNKKMFNVFLPMIEVYHYESKSRGIETTKEKYLQYIEEEKYFRNKWENYIINDSMYNKNYSKKKAFFLENKK